ncbi:uncharacterized protein LOC132884550 [Neoarius graeffei]|uniref:uncharacterized protein LOC132884550 n=1 Tax=Neoarius graeffei TaxID=443677 RepID=UPI00298CC4C2|nr:uncharacterized protein LOC132884550 [Neoarius graeffei]
MFTFFQKMHAYPVFRRQSATSARLLMAPTSEANRVENKVSARAQPKEEVLKEASNFVRSNGGDPSDQFLVLAHCLLQFGKYQGQRFIWLLENSLGYALALLHSISNETALPNPLSENKQLFLQYTSHIKELPGEVEKYAKKKELQAQAQATGDTGCLLLEFGDFEGRSLKEVYEDQSHGAQKLVRYVLQSNARPNTNMALFKAYILKRRSAEGTSTREHQPSPASSASASSPAPSPTTIQTGPRTPASVKALLACGKHLPPSQLAKKLVSPVKPSPAPQLSGSSTAHRRPEPIPQQLRFLCGPSEADDEELVRATQECETQLQTAATMPPLAATMPPPTAVMPPPTAAMPPPVEVAQPQPPVDLPSHWKDHLPPFQQEWIRHTLFKANPKTGKPELVTQLKLWWHPPQPTLIHTQPPASPNQFFCRPLFLWMPHSA